MACGSPSLEVILREMLSPECRAAVDRCRRDVRRHVEIIDIPGSDAARAAAYVITSVEAARERVVELRDS